MASNYRKLGDVIKLVDERNSDGRTEELLGVAIEKRFMPSVANVIGTDLSKYKLVIRDRFACNPMHVGRDEKLPIARYDANAAAIVSPAYFTFDVASEKVLPRYLELWFNRSEFDRRCWFATDASVRGGLSWDAMCDIPIDLPTMEEQSAIVKRFDALEARISQLRLLNDKLAVSMSVFFEELFASQGVSIYEFLARREVDSAAFVCDEVSAYASIQTGPFGSQLHQEDYVAEGTPIITVEHMRNWLLSHAGVPMVSNSDVQRLSKYTLAEGDTVFSRVGSVDRVSLVTDYEDGWLFSGRCLRVRPNAWQLARYLFSWFAHPAVVQLIVASAVGATMPSLNTAILSSIPVLIPCNPDIITRYDKQSGALIGAIANNNHEIRVLEKMRQEMLGSLGS